VTRFTSGARALVLVSSMAFVLGNCGAMSSCAALSPSTTPTSTLGATHQTEAESKAYEDFARRLTDTLVRPVHRRVVAAANLAVSMLLIVGASVLLLRRQSGVWWLGQAALANIAWSIGDCISFGAALRTGGGIDRAYLAYAEAAGQLPPETLAELSRGGPGFTGVALALYLARAALAVSLYAFLYWRVGRPDVAEALTATAQE